MTLAIIFMLTGCVGPPGYDDGLLENIPAVVIESDYFSLSVLGDKYTETNEWELAFNFAESDQILTTMVIKDLAINSSDSSYVFLVDEQGDTIFNVGLFSDVIFTSQDSILIVGIPNKVILDADNFSGRLQYQIIKTSL